jgi:hypothetical protein
MENKIEKLHGYFNISKSTFTKSSITVKVNSDIFETPVIMTINDEFISIKRATICYEGKTNKFSHLNSGWYATTVSGILPLGRVYIDEDSNEDEIIAYFK